MKPFWMVARWLSVALILLLGLPVWAQGSALRVGDVAPDFALKDPSGKEVRMSALKGNNNLILVFYNSYY